MKIRRGTEADLEQIFPLYAQLAAPGTPLTLERLRETWERQQKERGFALYVAENDGAIIGTFLLIILEALGARCRPVAIVEDVVVEAAQRGQGIGRAMMLFALDRAREAGCYKLMLSSNKNRVDAHRFYESLGFERHGVSFSIEPNS